MKTVYGYIRVSTKEQGDSASLPEQKSSITEYAKKNSLHVIKWYEEKKTAAKRGRPLFTEMMENLKSKKAEGVIMHKIDRSARNLHDWAAVGDLTDIGIEVHFAHESLDMTERGGRLTADIQAVMASDYIRNLKQEINKGLYGRLKQGIYPFAAPIGYLNNGGGKVKTIDPKMGPHIQELFRLYATGGYNIIRLAEVMNERGLRNIKGKTLCKNAISRVLNNPFYAGVIQIKEQTFKGKHEVLVQMADYKRVQLILSGNRKSKGYLHRYLFRKLLKCESCNFIMPGELQKGKMYYRCHTKGCQTKTLQENLIQFHIRKILKLIRLTKKEYNLFMECISQHRSNQKEFLETRIKSLTLNIDKLKAQQSNLLDAFLENIIDKKDYNERKNSLNFELRELDEELGRISSRNDNILDKLSNFLELCISPLKLYDSGIYEEKREILKTITSNLGICGRKVSFTMVSPFRELANRQFFASSGPDRT